MLSLYKSSAGSGKTFTLVKEYLKLCLPAPEKYRGIVAITFTNAASSEMKERILSKLKGLADGGEEDLRNILLSEGLTEKEVANAGKVLENILYNYANFSVSTIDSFFHKILRAFSKELDLPLDFEIFLENEEALEYSVDTLIFQSHVNPTVHKILVQYIREKINQGNSWLIRSDLQRIARELLKDTTFLMGKVDYDSILEFIDELKKLIREYEEEMDGIGKAGIKTMEEYGLGLEDFKYGKTGPANYFNKIQKFKREYEPGVRLLNALTDEEQWLNKKSATFRAAEEALQVSLLGLANDAFNKYINEGPDYLAARAVMGNIYTFAVYEEMHKTLMEYKEKNQVVLISDFNKILATHLIKEQISFIYSKIGSRYEHFLIDEFQDTSALQWLNLRPLLEDAISQGSQCLVVGDSKQAIYRWRGGQVELIERQLTEHDFPHNCRKINLNRNFRSRTEVVKFNNYFFSNIKTLFAGDFFERKLLEQIFEDASQEPAAGNSEGGYVEIAFLEKEGRTREMFLAVARERMLQSIGEALNEGFCKKDITVLIRDKKDAADVARTLFAHGIEFISQDSLFLDNSPAVSLVFSLLNYLDDKRNDLAKTEVIFLYLTYFQPELAVQPTYSEIFSDHKKETDGLYDKHLPEEFSKNIFGLSTLPIYEIVEELIRIFKLNASPDAYLQRFQDVVLEYSQKEKRSIRGFLEWWRAQKYSVVMPEDIDAVKIMTIHKSKGLEFPVVIIPYADWDFKSGQPDLLWIEPEKAPFNRFEKLPVLAGKLLAESSFGHFYRREEALIAIDNLNLLYVAFTRARDRLYVFTEAIKKNPEEMKSIPDLASTILTPGKPGPQVLIYGEKANSRPDLAKIKPTEVKDANTSYNLSAWRGRIPFSNGKSQKPLDAQFSDLIINTYTLEQRKEKLENLKERDEAQALKFASMIQQFPLSQLFSQNAMLKYPQEIAFPGGKTFRPDVGVEIGLETIIFKIIYSGEDKEDLNFLKLYTTHRQQDGKRDWKGFLIDFSDFSLSVV